MVSMTSDTDNSHEENFAALFEESSSTRTSKKATSSAARVIQVGKDYVVVDIGYKSEGMIPLDEFARRDGTVGVKAGDVVDVFLESRENDDGLCVLSKEKADQMKVWDEISGACERDELIEGTITQRVKGGLSVTIRGGVKAFLPGSQVDLRPVRNLDKFIGQNYKFKVIKFNKKRGNIVLSRRVLLEKERAELKEPDARDPQGRPDRRGHRQEPHRVRRVHRPRRHRRPPPHHRHELGPGQPPVASCSRSATTSASRSSSSTPRPSASRSASSRSARIPWSHAQEKYPPGTVVRGKVVSLKDYGAFIELEQGIEGLVHVCEMSWTRRVKHPSKMVAVGDIVEAVVLDVDAKPEPHLARHEAARAEPVRVAHREVPARHRRARARSATSPTSASSSRSKKASTAWSTSATCPGPSA